MQIHRYISISVRHFFSTKKLNHILYIALCSHKCKIFLFLFYPFSLVMEYSGDRGKCYAPIYKGCSKCSKSHTGAVGETRKFFTIF